ncbi:hypothetical protein H6P81_021326 [Aristolochia fimbriata]|uniref:Uncharacterized protein n=1 Tax=Aristolochia fimbriata TaxID=158543 RepID=A0AAV7DT73_ARIFI|nr:hypothetical protein H6P81_021326 [Aristolochia fimbriata]
MSSARIISPGEPGNKKEGQCPPPTNGISKIALKVVVFHFSPVETAPTYPTPLKSFHKVGLESSSTGSSFPLILPSPFPWLWFIWIVGGGESHSYSRPFTSAWLNFFTLTLSGQKSHCVSIAGPSQCFVLIKRSVPLVRYQFESAVRRRGRPPKGRSDPSPARRGDQLARRERFEQSTGNPAGWGWDPVPSPSSQSFSKIYGSILPTSLAYIVPSTRGCSPWRPDAVMMYDQAWAALSVLRFSRAPRAAGTPAASRCSSSRWTLPPAEPFQGRARPPYSSRPGCCPAAGMGWQQKRHPFSGLVDSAGLAVGRRNPAFGSSRIASSAYQKWPTWSSDSCMLTLEPFSEDLGRSAVQPARGSRQSASLRLTGLVPAGFAHMSDSLVRVSRRVEWGTRWPGAKRRAGAARNASGGRSATLLGPREAAYQRRDHPPGLGSPVTSVGRRPSRRRTGSRRPAHDRRIARPHPLPSRQFQALFDSLFKVLFIFPSRYLLAIGLSPLFSLGRNLPPYLGCIPKQPDFADKRLAVAAGSGHKRGCHPLWRPIPWDLRPRVFPPDLGCLIRARPRSAEAAAPAGVLLSGGLGPRPAPGGGGGRSHHSSCEVPLGQSVFSQPRPGARATNLLAPATRPHRQRWGSSRTRGGGRLRRRGAQAASRTVAGAGAETRRRPVSSGEGFDRRFAPGSARRPRGIRYIEPNRQASPAIEHFTDHSIGRAAGALRPYSPEPKTLISHKVRVSPKSNIRPIPGAASFMVETRAHGAATRPVKARGASPGRRGESSRHLYTPWRTDRPTQGPTSELFKRNNLNISLLGWNYGGCWHRTCPQWILVKGFRLYSFQLPDSRAGIVIYCHYLPCRGLGNFWRLLPSLDVDQPGSILERPRRLNRARSRVRLSTGAGASAVEQKLRRSDFVCESTKSIGTAAFTWVHEHFRASGVRAHRRETKRGRKKIAGPDCARPYPRDDGSAAGFKGTIHQRRAAPGEKTHKHQGNASDPTRQREVRASEGKGGSGRGGGSSDGSTTQRMSSVHHFAAAPAIRRARCPARAWRANKKRHKAPA